MVQARRRTDDHGKDPSGEEPAGQESSIQNADPSTPRSYFDLLKEKYPEDGDRADPAAPGPQRRRAGRSSPLLRTATRTREGRRRRLAMVMLLLSVGVAALLWVFLGDPEGVSTRQPLPLPVAESVVADASLATADAGDGLPASPPATSDPSTSTPEPLVTSAAPQPGDSPPAASASPDSMPAATPVAQSESPASPPTSSAPTPSASAPSASTNVAAVDRPPPAAVAEPSTIVEEADDPVVAEQRAAANLDPPVKVFAPQPEYPLDGGEATGVVVLEGVVSSVGDVASARVLRGLGEPFDQAALEAFRTWQFQPAVRDEVAVSAPYRVAIHFAPSRRRGAAPLPFGGDFEPPTRLVSPLPALPAEAWAAGITGDVVMRVVVDSSGVVDDIEVLEGLPYGVTETAVRTVRAWRFSPALRDGEPVTVYHRLRLRFAR